MADQQARDEQYRYSAMSNLVLQADRASRQKEPHVTGEPESLWGKIDPKQMGSSVTYEKAPKTGGGDTSGPRGKKKSPSGTLDEDEAFEKEQRRRKRQEERSLRTDYGYSNILAATEDMEGLSYRPRTRETLRIWELILSFVSQYLSDMSPEVVRSASDEALAILKNDKLKDIDRKKEIDQLLNIEMSMEKFASLVNLGKQIADYNEDEGAAGTSGYGGDLTKETEELEEGGVAVVFDADDDDEDGEGEGELGQGFVDKMDDFVVDESEGDSDEDSNEDADNEDEEVGPKAPHYGDSGNRAQAASDDDEESVPDGEEQVIRSGIKSKSKSNKSQKFKAKDKSEVDIQDIDAFWLQRQVAKYFTDPHIAQQKTQEALAIMSEPQSTLRVVENGLVSLFDYEHFDLVKLLTHNRDAIVWCTKLARASDEDEATKIRASISGQGLGWILEKLTKKESTSTSNPLEAALDKAAASTETAENKQNGEKDFGSRRMDIEDEEDEAPPKVVNLDDLSFTQGGHLMSNTKCRLPEGSFKRSSKGYEEIHVPYPKVPPMEKGEKLVPLSELPEWTQQTFSGTKSLNRIQSRVYPTAFLSDENMLVCAPTGAGKTNVAMLTILHEIGKYRDPKTGELALDEFKLVYVAPMKALVQEMAGSFTKRLEPLGIKVAELTGDSQLTKQQLAETQVIVTTPEKWDIVTRKGSDRSYTSLVRLVIIDEIHLLHDDRGPVLEALVSRILRTIEQTQQPVRLVGLSATLPNYEDVATFLRVNLETGLFFFSGAYRPCPLSQVFVGITEKKAIKRLTAMNEVVYEKVVAQAGKNQTLVFVHSRKETSKTARALRELALERGTLDKFLAEGSASREILLSEAESTKDPVLQDILPYGFAVHHAGMSRADRTLVEELFSDGHIQVLVSTATLAWGVNLPAHQVIIKGTQIYSPEKGSWTELSPQDILQMLGRAGRPQYDTFGEGVLITTHGELQYYLSLLNQQLPIESQLASRLPDLLNAEIALGTVRSRQDSVQWLGYSYYYVRMLRNPSLYSVSLGELDTDPYLRRKRSDLAHSALIQLEKSGMVRYDRRTGKIQSTPLGRIASHYYLSYRTVRSFIQLLRPTSGPMEMLRIFSTADEFRLIPVRQEEKAELASLLDRVPIPVKESIETPSAKIAVLLQAYISRLQLTGFALASDMVYVTQSAGRLWRAIFEICLQRGWARPAKASLNWCKQSEHRMWMPMTPLRQFPDSRLPKDLIRRVERRNMPWERCLDLEPHELGEWIGAPKAGKLLHKYMHSVPRLDVRVHALPLTRTLLRVELTLTPDFQWDAKYHGAAQVFWIWVEDADGENLLYSEQFILKEMYATSEHVTEFTCQLQQPLPPNYFVSVSSDRWIASEVRVPVSFHQMRLPDKFMPHTELLDLQPLGPEDVFSKSEFRNLYTNEDSPLRIGRSGERRMFNPIQTQAFNALYEKDENVVLSAAAGSGKTVAAEFALLRLWNNEAKRAAEDPDNYFRRRAVYIVPFANLAKLKTRLWAKRFKDVQGGKTVVCLTGEGTADLKLLDRADMVVATPSQWDGLSRRWKQRRNVQTVGLFIGDNMEWIGGGGIGSLDESDENGTDTSTYEVVVSRMRYMSVQTELPVRIVLLSSPVANVYDLASWIGAPKSCVFSFGPMVRPTPVDLHIQSYTIPHFASLMSAMVRPTYFSILGYAGGLPPRRISPDGKLTDVNKGNPAIVFVPNSSQTRITADELLVCSAADGFERQFLRVSDTSVVESHISRVQDKDLQEFLRYGIATYHETMSNNDRAIVERLFLSGVIQVIVAARESCWALDHIQATTVVMMGTQRYHGSEHRYVDYSIPDIQQMVGRSGRPGIDDQGVCVLMCNANKKSYFKKFLEEAMPLESRLDQQLHDPLNTEVVTKTIENKQDAVDYLTWSFLYRRLPQNPNYYGLQGTSHTALSDYLSELIESTLQALLDAGCLVIDEDDMDVSASNLGMIASFYQIRYMTIEMFAQSLTATTKLRGILDIVSAADEFESIPIRHREKVLLTRLADRVPLGVPKTDGPMHTSARAKTQLLLQAHFSRIDLPVDLRGDQKWVLGRIVLLLQAMVDVSSSQGWLKPAISAMELSQMIVQAFWDGRDPIVKQIPHLGTRAMLENCKKAGIESVFDVMDMEDEDRASLMKSLTPVQVKEVAQYCNRYPSLEIDVTIKDEDEITAGDVVEVVLNVERELDEDDVAAMEAKGIVPPGPVIAPFFPTSKDECWWVVIGDPETQTLVSVKRITVGTSAKPRVQFQAPEKPGKVNWKCFVICDSYSGCDQEFDIELDVKPSEDSSDDDDDDDESGSDRDSMDQE
ncbi:Pre-mRNA splicing [Mycoemilia scoparia]|uniref:Pre-mRNA splicing n=1 Tax=Mycoemilia scoparia TaxID=417184 RepID=A0A9W8A3J6_9FUNG|nr:Pre-mRNA splicing [Mycoemilia scoparia]